MSNCLSQVLKNKKIIVKAPGRVDLGGGIDHRIISLICQDNDLSTFNIAIKLYTHITLESYKKNFILIDSDKVGQKEISSSNSQFNDKFGLIAAIARFFNVDGVKITIKTEFPPMSGLGGSGSLGVALISAFVLALNLNNLFSKKGIVWLAHSIEDSLFKNTGLQDQAAACYGGINFWIWKYSKFQEIYQQEPIVNTKIDFEKHSLVIYSGCPHYLTRKGSKIIYSFLKKDNNLDFVKKISENTAKFKESLLTDNIDLIIDCINTEEKLRSDFLEYKIPSAASKIITTARKNNCGVKFVGGGGGGCLWVLGQEDNLLKFKKEIYRLKTIQFLPFSIDYDGVVAKSVQVKT